MQYWVWLTTRHHINAAFGAALLDWFGSPQAIWEAQREALAAVPSMTQVRLDSLLEKDLSGAQRILRDCKKSDTYIVTIQDENYPYHLRSILQPPLLLYVRGSLPDFRQKLAITIVGTRKASPYGLHASRYFAGNLAQNNCIIVSGMALGIDGQANRAAIEAGGTTVAVLGCGTDVCYPWQNEPLMKEIIQHGAVISEYPPGTEPTAWHFPQRNRIMTGLSRGVLLVEAPKKSGAMISANYALEQGRDVFAVPADINRPNGEGCNMRIREGSAELVQSPADILAYYGHTEDIQYQTVLANKPQRPAPQRKLAANTPAPAPAVKRKVEGNEVECKVWQAVAQQHKTVDAIVDHTGLSAAEVLTALTMLEVGAYIIRADDGVYPAADAEL